MLQQNALALETDYFIENDYFMASEALIPRNILIIEDNRSDVIMIKKMLQDAPELRQFEYTDVPRMVDALELLESYSYDLILLDLNLLDIEGIAAVSALHALIPNTPIIVHSGANDSRIKHEALMCGARHFLVKGRESPFSFKFMVQQSLAHAET